MSRLIVITLSAVTTLCACSTLQRWDPNNNPNPNPTPLFAPVGSSSCLAGPPPTPYSVSTMTCQGGACMLVPAPSVPQTCR
jgi:hypothetical protein